MSLAEGKQVDAEMGSEEEWAGAHYGGELAAQTAKRIWTRR